MITQLHAVIWEDGGYTTAQTLDTAKTIAQYYSKGDRCSPLFCIASFKPNFLNDGGLPDSLKYTVAMLKKTHAALRRLSAA